MTNIEAAIQLACMRGGWNPIDCTAEAVDMMDQYRVTHIPTQSWLTISGLEVHNYARIENQPKLGGFEKLHMPQEIQPNGRYTPKKVKPGAIRKNEDGLDECFINGKWEIWNPAIPDAGHPSDKRRETEPPTYEQLRRAYHERVIRVGNNRNHTRMVGHCELKDYDGNGESGKMIKLWFPEKDFEKNDGKLDYNLVFSLASDGHHYLVADRDDEIRGPSANIWVPSSTNWHEYGTTSCTWHDVVLANAQNVGYLKQIQRKQMAALRPPWIMKDDDQPLWPMSKYNDLEPWKHKATPVPESPELAWDQLGWDDDE